MGPVIGDLLPLALGIAISPTPVAAVIVMLLSTRGQVTSLGFVLGWIIGVALAIFTLTWLSALVPQARFSVSPALLGTAEMLLGLVLVGFGIRQWTSRNATSTDDMPRWLRAVDTLKPWQALPVGFVYAAFRPKNFVLTAAAALVITDGEVTFAESLVAIGVFTVIASATLAFPVVASLTGIKNTRALLEGFRERILKNVGVITGTALLILGVVVLGMGIGEF